MSRFQTDNIRANGRAYLLDRSTRVADLWAADADAFRDLLNEALAQNPKLEGHSFNALLAEMADFMAESSEAEW